MRDLLFLALALGFFAVCIAYIHLCDRIIGAVGQENWEAEIHGKAAHSAIRRK